MAEANNSIAFLSNHLAQARVDVRKAEEKVKEAGEKANKAMDDLEAEQVNQAKKWSSFDELEKAIRVLLEFGDLVRNIANRGFDFAMDEVRKLAPELDLTSIYKAYEAELDEEDDKGEVQADKRAGEDEWATTDA